MIALLPYQKEHADNIAASVAQHRVALDVANPGSGKISPAGRACFLALLLTQNRIINMSTEIKKIFVTGFPSLYDGAGTELHHQIIVWRKCYNGDCHLQSPELKNAWAIHLWGEMLRHEPNALEKVSRNSIVGQLLDKHLPGHAASAASAVKKKARILVGICSCTSAAQRRKVCRETWMSHPQILREDGAYILTTSGK